MPCQAEGADSRFSSLSFEAYWGHIGITGYIYTYIYIYVCMYVCMYVSNVCMYVCMYVFTHIYIYNWDNGKENGNYSNIIGVQLLSMADSNIWGWN